MGWPFHFSPDRPRQFKQRAAALVLTLVLECLVGFALLSLGSSLGEDTKAPSKLTTFQLLPPSKAAPEPARQARTVAKAKPSPAETPAPPKPPPPPTPPAPSMLVLSKEEFAAADISTLSRAQEGSAGQGSGKNSVAAYGPGEGPDGKPLFNAEWYREPTRAELLYYLPPNVQTGWGLIACKTAEKYRVENCRTLGESPIGSGLAKAMRLASWQFLVRPPRLDGRPLIGAWVRIRFDMTTGVAQ